jgi:hypothetical protein
LTRIASSCSFSDQSFLTISSDNKEKFIDALFCNCDDCPRSSCITANIDPDRVWISDGRLCRPMLSGYDIHELRAELKTLSTCAHVQAAEDAVQKNNCRTGEVINESTVVVCREPLRAFVKSQTSWVYVKQHGLKFTCTSTCFNQGKDCTHVLMAKCAQLKTPTHTNNEMSPLAQLQQQQQQQQQQQGQEHKHPQQQSKRQQPVVLKPELPRASLPLELNAGEPEPKHNGRPHCPLHGDIASISDILQALPSSFSSSTPASTSFAPASSSPLSSVSHASSPLSASSVLASPSASHTFSGSSPASASFSISSATSSTASSASSAESTTPACSCYCACGARLPPVELNCTVCCFVFALV